ncbi:MAG: hypothetical protein ABI390_11790 [Daejeonella sp.]
MLKQLPEILYNPNYISNFSDPAFPAADVFIFTSEKKASQFKINLCLNGFPEGAANYNESINQNEFLSLLKRKEREYQYANYPGTVMFNPDFTAKGKICYQAFFTIREFLNMVGRKHNFCNDSLHYNQNFFLGLNL